MRDFQTVLKAFYGVIKSTEAAQRFVLVTGVSKFSKVSIFSDLNNLTDLNVPETAFSAYEPDRLEPLPLLVQTGYLTVKSAEIRGSVRMYQLGFPNQEIEQSFSYWLAQGFACLPAQDMSSALQRLVRALDTGNVAGLLETLKTFFAQVPNTITQKHEKYYQTIFFTVFTLIGAMTEAEVSTNIGRVDAVVKTKSDIFLFEFKLGGSAQAAMRQMREMRYAEPYGADGRRVRRWCERGIGGRWRAAIPCRRSPRGTPEAGVSAALRWPRLQRLGFAQRQGDRGVSWHAYSACF